MKHKKGPLLDLDQRLAAIQAHLAPQEQPDPIRASWGAFGDWDKGGDWENFGDFKEWGK